MDPDTDNQYADDEPLFEDEVPDGPSWGMRVVIIIMVLAMLLTVSWWIVLPTE